MIGNHFQRPTQDWPAAAKLYPPGTPVLAIDNVQQLAEAKSVNPGLFTILRHYYTPQQVFPDSDLEAAKGRARAYFQTFIDGTFRQYAATVNAITEWNEYCDNSHIPPAQMDWLAAQGSTRTGFNQPEYQKRLSWLQAVNEVWTKEYRPDPAYAHIKLVSVNAPPGNSIPAEYAAIVQQHNGLLGHHPYTAVSRDGLGKIRHDDAKWYSGRWQLDDAYYRSRGVSVQWLGTESGPCGTDIGGGMYPEDGWRLASIMGGDPAKYLIVLAHRLAMISTWNKLHGGRYRGEVLFNSSGGDLWPSFDVRQPEMSQFAAFIKDFGGNVPPPPVTGQTAVLVAPFNVRNAPRIAAGTRLYTGQPGQHFEVIGPAQGDVFAGSTEWVALKVYVHKSGLRLE